MLTSSHLLAESLVQSLAAINPLLSSLRPEDAEDIKQSVALLVLERHEQGETIASIHAFARVVARRKRDNLLRVGYRKRKTLPLAHEVPVRASCSFEVGELLDAARRKLSPRAWACFQAVANGEMTYEQAAAHFEIPRRQIAHWYHAAVTTCRRLAGE